MELTVIVQISTSPTMRSVAETAERMSRYQSRVLLRSVNVTVNAKSLMGLLSLGLKNGMPCTIIASGEDEAQAVVEMSRLLTT